MIQKKNVFYIKNILMNINLDDSGRIISEKNSISYVNVVSKTETHIL